MSQKAEHRAGFTENRPDSSLGIASTDRGASQPDLRLTSFVGHTRWRLLHTERIAPMSRRIATHRRHSGIAARRARTRFRFAWERCEERTLLSTFTVTTTDDNGDNVNPTPG